MSEKSKENPSETSEQSPFPQSTLLGELLWRLKDIRADLMSNGLGGRCYNCDEWSTPIINLNSAIKIIESKIQPNAQDDEPLK